MINFAAALVVARAATCPRHKILSRREHGHIDADFSDNGNGGHRVLVEARNGVNQIKGGCERRGDSADFRFDVRPMQFEFVDVVKALAEQPAHERQRRQQRPEFQEEGSCIDDQRREKRRMSHRGEQGYTR